MKKLKQSFRPISAWLTTASWKRSTTRRGLGERLERAGMGDARHEDLFGSVISCNSHKPFHRLQIAVAKLRRSVVGISSHDRRLPEKLQVPDPSGHHRI